MIDIDEIEQLAKLAGGDAWTPTYAGRTTLATVWLPDGDSVCQCHGNIGHQPEPIDADHVAEYIGAVSPANVLALIAEVRALREDAERYRRAIALEDNVEALYGAVVSCGPSARESINIEVDAARGAK